MMFGKLNLSSLTLLLLLTSSLRGGEGGSVNEASHASRLVEPATSGAEGEARAQARSSATFI